ncbi:hypothetical protein LWC34_14565 [Kibdelosporangium philippinense]|uniref:Peptidoglycan binding domain-containing protein n=1 Tax=Kibdelosporangium philippinense TaxID=211113 RepID=A0ABS8ZB57_9PSEU|nr:hypothetical protein [Kibdelosporangium philippinense]MCE7004045.1 hypothetical protein [Kibdelosporangium philippinense]
MTSAQPARPASRRLFLGSTVGAIALAGFTATDAAAAPGSTSANGWPILTTATEFRIEGSNQAVRLADTDAATILVHVARRFHYEIDTLRDGDVVGFAPGRPVTQPFESNYLSGTAMTIRSVCYPLGAHGGFYPWEQTVIRDILAELGGAVSWGGDERTPKESHFQIAKPPGDPAIRAAAQRIRGWNDAPGGHGAGAVDAFDANRVQAARQFQLYTR